MLTQCPHCQTTFRVTSEILRVADGQVRCGRCQTQFDALERLIDENDAGEVESGRFLRPPRSTQAVAPAGSPYGPIHVEEPATHEDITLEGRHIEISGTYEVLDDSGRGEPRVRQEVTEEWVEIDDIEETSLDVDEKGVDEDAQAAAEDLESQIEALDEVSAQDEDDESGGAEAAIRDSRFAPVPLARKASEGSRAGAARRPREESAPPASDEAAASFDLLTPPRRAVSPAWKILAAPLALLLAIQAVHHYRAALARHPRVGAPLIDVYEALGLQLTPDWNLHAYEIRQWGVVSDPRTPGTLTVRASITNLAQFAQPYPLLKLVLENRWGDQVRAREFEPAEYLDPAAAPERLLAPGQKTNATVNIVDPGPDAEGFRFDVCLRGRKGTVCAGDVAP